MSALAGCVAVLLGVGMAPAQAGPLVGDVAVRAHVATTALKGFNKAPASVLMPGTVVDAVSIHPRAHRLVRVQAERPGSKVFVTVSSGFSNKHGDFAAVYKPTRVGRWHFRLSLPATGRATRLVSASRSITATTDTTAPGPVSGVSVVQGVGSELSLSWVNPTDADFAGVMIRRTVGLIPPASPTQGVLVTNTAAVTTTFTDQGLAGDTTYSYALFAFDTAKNKAAAATRTVVSGAATTATLTVNGSTGPTAFDTVNVAQVYDVSTGTHAGRTLTIVSGTLDYGDSSTPEEFVGDPSTWAPAGHQYAVTGIFTATLTVVDSASKTASTPIQIHVVAQPTATITVDPASVLEKGKDVRFLVTSGTPAGTSFTDFDHFSDAGDNFISGAGNPPASFTINFAAAGTYSVTVEGFNDAGGLATASVPVVIVDAPPPTP